MKRKRFVLNFDIAEDDFCLQKRVLRALHRIGAKKLQQSMWESDKLQYF